MDLSNVAGITLQYRPNPAGEDYDGYWGLYREGLEIAACADMNWARNILAALNHTHVFWDAEPDALVNVQLSKHIET